MTEREKQEERDLHRRHCTQQHLEQRLRDREQNSLQQRQEIQRRRLEAEQRRL